MRITYYANYRKMYDKDAKKYVTLTKLCEAVHGGNSVEIIDHVTGEDITNRILKEMVSYIIVSNEELFEFILKHPIKKE